MANAPDLATATLLGDASIGLTLGVNLFRGPVRDVDDRKGNVPHCAVFCLATGGPEPVRCVNGNQGPRIKYENVQITIRANPSSVEKSFDDGQTLARQVWTVVEAAEIAGYMKFDARDSAPVYIGQDDKEHHRWTINIETMREE